MTLRRRDRTSPATRAQRPKSTTNAMAVCPDSRSASTITADSEREPAVAETSGGSHHEQGKRGEESRDAQRKREERNARGEPRQEKENSGHDAREHREDGCRGHGSRRPARTQGRSCSMLRPETSLVLDAPRFGRVYSVEYGMSAIWRARRMAVRTLRWHGAQVPNMRRGRIFARSGMNARRSFVFL